MGSDGVTARQKSSETTDRFLKWPILPVRSSRSRREDSGRPNKRLRHDVGARWRCFSDAVENEAVRTRNVSVIGAENAADKAGGASVFY